MFSRKRLLTLSVSLFSSWIKGGIFFVFVAPTKTCNMKCCYCYQAETYSEQLSLDVFLDIIAVLQKLGLGIISFTGGEPLLWSYINDAVEICSRQNLFTEVTTNGSLLTRKQIDALSDRGLRYLLVSIDSVSKNPLFPKSLEAHPDLLENLEYAKHSKGIIVSCNTVLTLKNADEVGNLAEALSSASIPLSIGFVDQKTDSCYSSDALAFSLSNDRALLRKTVDRIIELKRNGCLIIEPEDYFLNYENHLNNKATWRCLKPNGRSFTIGPDGNLYICSRLNEPLFPAQMINQQSFRSLRKEIAEKVSVCNPSCYANCSFNNYYYKIHPLSFLKNVVIPWLGMQTNN